MGATGTRRAVGRVTALALAGALIAACAWDLSRPPGRQHSAAQLLGAIHFYQETLAPVLAGAGVRCRFTPTCSHYAVGAIRKHGALGGTWRAARRLLRCGPWTPAGTVDPP